MTCWLVELRDVSPSLTNGAPSRSAGGSTTIRHVGDAHRLRPAGGDAGDALAVDPRETAGEQLPLRRLDALEVRRACPPRPSPGRPAPARSTTACRSGRRSRCRRCEPASTARARELFAASWASWYCRHASAPATAAKSSSAPSAASATVAASPAARRPPALLGFAARTFLSAHSASARRRLWWARARIARGTIADQGRARPARRWRARDRDTTPDVTPCALPRRRPVLGEAAIAAQERRPNIRRTKRSGSVAISGGAAVGDAVALEAARVAARLLGCRILLRSARPAAPGAFPEHGRAFRPETEAMAEDAAREHPAKPNWRRDV